MASVICKKDPSYKHCPKISNEIDNNLQLLKALTIVPFCYLYYFSNLMTVNISVSLQPEQLQKLNQLRGDVPKSKFIQKLIDGYEENK